MDIDTLILAHILHVSPIDIAIKRPVLDSTQHAMFDGFKLRLSRGEPLQYILGEWDFYGLTFKLNSSVLVPRPETECMVEKAIEFLKDYPKASVLDLGTGSGNIPVTIAKFRPLVNIMSVDISAEALAIAKTNAVLHGVEDRITFECQDMLTLNLGKDHSFDLVISNPPYIPTQIIGNLPLDVQAQPHGALDGGVDGLRFYETIIKTTRHLLRNTGCLMMEFGDGQAESIRRACNAYFTRVNIYQDLAGRDRFVVAT